jgi:hypothetical protein
VSKPAAAEGETVTITAQPDYKYVFEGTPLVSGATASGAGPTYSFTMPNTAVTVSVSPVSTYNNRFLCTDASLENITFNNGLSVNFQPTTFGYTLTADNGIASITVTPEKTEYPYRTITVNGGTPITLNPGNNTIPIVVTPESGNAVTYTVTAKRRPATPVISLLSLPATGKIKLDWAVPAGEQTYEIYRSIIQATPGDTVTPTYPNLSETTYTDTGLINGTPYYYYVRARLGDLPGAWSIVSSAQPGITTWDELKAEINSLQPKTLWVAGIIEMKKGDSSSSSSSITISNNITVIPVDAGATLKRASSFTGTMFEVAGQGTLTLGQSGMKGTLTLDGVSQSSPTSELIHVTGQLATIEGGGTLNMYDGVILQNNESHRDAGAIELETKGTFNMYGGTITKNSGQKAGGVFLKGSTSQTDVLIMNFYGGTIGQNTKPPNSLVGILCYYKANWSNVRLNPSGGNCSSDEIKWETF